MQRDCVARAAAENLPFHDENMDAVVVGGSLNEMKSIWRGVARSESCDTARRTHVCHEFRAGQQKSRKMGPSLSEYWVESNFRRVKEFNGMAEEAGWGIGETRIEGHSVVQPPNKIKNASWRLRIDYW